MTTATCPVCGAQIDSTLRRGRPRTYCSDPCRWRRGHAGARERRRQRAEAAAAWTDGEVLAWLASLPNPLKADAP